jgi:hypothetical protein
MPHIEGAILIERPVEEVFDVVADARNEPHYNPNLLSAELTTPAPIGPGTRFRLVGRALGRAVETVYEVTAYDRPRRRVSRTLTAPLGMAIRGTDTLEAVAGGTRLRWSEDLEVHGLLKPFASVLARSLGRRLDIVFANLKLLLEAEETPVRRGVGRSIPCAFPGLRAAARTAVFLIKVFPMLPSRPLNWLTPRPVVERLRYATSHGDVEGELYRPATAGPHPGILICLGVVPFGVDHPQVPRLGEALARSGFAALLYWSPAMRDFRLDPADIGDIASAYEALLAHSDVDAARSGLLGTCVGGAFALMAAADPRIRDRVAFVSAYAPYASMWTLARDIASATSLRDGVRRPWAVDPLTWKVYVHSVTALLAPDEATRLRAASTGRRGRLDDPSLSDDGRAVAPLLTALDPDGAEAALHHLPAALQERLTAMSPVQYLSGVRAPLIILLHDRDDVVIPVGESRRLRRALAGRAGVRYTEFTVFKHLDPTKGKPSPPALARELLRFARAIYPLFRHAAAQGGPPAPSRDRRPGDLHSQTTGNLPGDAAEDGPQGSNGALTPPPLEVVGGRR